MLLQKHYNILNFFFLHTDSIGTVSHHCLRMSNALQSQSRTNASQGILFLSFYSLTYIFIHLNGLLILLYQFHWIHFMPSLVLTFCMINATTNGHCKINLHPFTYKNTFKFLANPCTNLWKKLLTYYYIKMNKKVIHFIM